MEAVKTVFGELTPVEIRVSHQVNGRVPNGQLVHHLDTVVGEQTNSLDHHRLDLFFSANIKQRLCNPK
ncbi:MAG: hypothetical protein IJ604_07040 [Prevotella sp.]|nr:hypothetical protein [Prevotella sp.]MBR1463117.1 hypothetical protein [Prevotella sp.]